MNSTNSSLAPSSSKLVISSMLVQTDSSFLEHVMCFIIGVAQVRNAAPERQMMAASTCYMTDLQLIATGLQLQLHQYNYNYNYNGKPATSWNEISIRPTITTDLCLTK